MILGSYIKRIKAVSSVILVMREGYIIMGSISNECYSDLCNEREGCIIQVSCIPHQEERGILSRFPETVQTKDAANYVSSETKSGITH